MKQLLLAISLLSTLQAFAQVDLIPYRKGDKWGYANRQKEVVIEPQFEEVGEFLLSSITWIKKGDKYGFINKKGIFITKIEFDKVGFILYSMPKVTKGDSTFCLNQNGEYINCLNICGTRPKIGSEYFRTYKKDGYIGLLEYTELYINEDSLTAKLDSVNTVWTDFKENYLSLVAVKKNEKWGIINRNRALIIDYFYDDIRVAPHGSSNYFFVTKKDNHYGFINYEGKIIADPIYRKVDFFYSQLAKVWLTDDFWFYIDTNGTEYYER